MAVHQKTPNKHFKMALHFLFFFFNILYSLESFFPSFERGCDPDIVIMENSRGL